MSRLPGPPLLRHLAVAGLAAAVLFATSGLLSDYRNYLLAQVAVYAVAVVGLTVLTGLSGQISLGHGALMAVGAYVTAITERHLRAPVPLLLLAAAAVAALAGTAAGAAAARLHGPYLAGATLALAVGLPGLATRFPGTLGGEPGLLVAAPAPPAGLGATRWLAVVCWAAALGTLVLLANLVRSRYGRAFRAVRDDEVAAALAGLPVARIRVLAFVVSAACAGLAGGLLALVVGLAAPAGFGLVLSLALLTGVVLGGLDSLAGALVGALALVVLPELTTGLARSFDLPGPVRSNLAPALYGLLLITVMLVAPGGLAAAAGAVATRWAPSRRPAGPSTGGPTGGSEET